MDLTPWPPYHNLLSIQMICPVFGRPCCEKEKQNKKENKGLTNHHAVAAAAKRK